MNTPTIPMLLSPELITALESNNISAHNYKPAYDGKSVGLDLFNAGPDITVLPSTRDYIQDWAWAGKADPDIIERQFKQVFKILIPTGLRLALPTGWGAFIQERGSIIKTPLKVRAGVIDPEYTGEVFVNCVNIGTHPWDIPANSKLPFQLVVLPVNTNYEHVDPEEYEELTAGSTRKQGKIGSSDNP